MKGTKRIICLLLVAMMLISCTACQRRGASSELSDEIEYIYQYESAPVESTEQGDTQSEGATEDKNESSQNQATQNSQTESTQDKTESTQSKDEGTQNKNEGTQSNKNESTQSDKNTNTQSNKNESSVNSQTGNTQSNQTQSTQSETANNNQSQATSSEEKTDSAETYEDKAEKYRGTKVVLATWRDPNVDEDGPVIKAFEKKYGIDVEIDTIGQGGYVNTVASRIASGNAPDIFFCTAMFLSGLQCLQPIDVAEIDLSDPIWDQFMLEKSKVNGKSYLVNTVGNIWNEIACVFYNKKIFAQHNITTPEEYYNAGKWTFETFEKAMRDVTAASKDYIGAYIDYNALLGSTNSAYWNWEDGKISNGVNKRFEDVIRYTATWKKDGLIRGVGNQSYTSDFKNGKCGMALCEAWGLKKTGYWRNNDPADIGFTYIPAFDSNSKSYTTGIYRGWGICKGAKNPVAAGVFLRYYLDVNNYATDTAFITPEAESFFFKLTSSANMSNKNYYLVGGSDGLATAKSHAEIAKIANGDPGQVKSSLDALKNTIESDVKDLNNYLAKIK